MDFGIIKPLSIDLGRDSRKTGPRRESISAESVCSLCGGRERTERKKRRRKKERKKSRGRERESLSGNLSSRLTLAAITDWIKTVISTRIGRVGRACSPLLSESGIR